MPQNLLRTHAEHCELMWASANSCELIWILQASSKCYNTAQCNVPFRDGNFIDIFKPICWDIYLTSTFRTSVIPLQPIRVWKPQQGFFPASLLLGHPHAIPVDHFYLAFHPPVAPPPHRGHEHQALRSQHILQRKSSWRAECGEIIEYHWKLRKGIMLPLGAYILEIWIVSAGFTISQWKTVESQGPATRPGS